jgi:hypothetical protein
MKYKILATYTEADTWEDALKLVGAIDGAAYAKESGALFELCPAQLVASSALNLFDQGVYILRTPDEADELTEDDAEEIADHSLELANIFIRDMGLSEEDDEEDDEDEEIPDDWEYDDPAALVKRLANVESV